MSNVLGTALLFLINTIFDLYLFVLMVRIILVYVGANYFDPITRFIIKLTDFIVKPVRRFIPNVKRFELASILILFVLEIFKFLLVLLISFGTLNVLGLLLLALGDILKRLFITFFYAVLVQVILSWLQPYSPMNRLLYQFIAPVSRPFQRLIPPISGIDITPIFVLILLQLLIIIIANPLMGIAFGLAIGSSA